VGEKGAESEPHFAAAIHLYFSGRAYIPDPESLPFHECSILDGVVETSTL